MTLLGVKTLVTLLLLTAGFGFLYILYRKDCKKFGRGRRQGK